MRIKKRRLARIRFRSLIKTVILNRKWLAEFEDVTLGDNVNRNVAILVRSKGQKGILSLTVSSFHYIFYKIIFIFSILRRKKHC